MAEVREEILEEVVRREPRLLRVERAGVADAARAWLLSFDAGCLLVALDGEQLRIAFGADPAGAPEQLERADEEDPWWPVMGQPWVRAWALSSVEEACAALELQLRRDAERPKRISLRAAPGGIRVSTRSATEADG